MQLQSILREMAGTQFVPPSEVGKEGNEAALERMERGREREGKTCSCFRTRFSANRLRIKTNKCYINTVKHLTVCNNTS